MGTLFWEWKALVVRGCTAVPCNHFLGALRGLMHVTLCNLLSASGTMLGANQTQTKQNKKEIKLKEIIKERLFATNSNWFLIYPLISFQMKFTTAFYCALCSCYCFRCSSWDQLLPATLPVVMVALLALPAWTTTVTLLISLDVVLVPWLITSSRTFLKLVKMPVLRWAESSEMLSTMFLVATRDPLMSWMPSSRRWREERSSRHPPLFDAPCLRLDGSCFGYCNRHRCQFAKCRRCWQCQRHSWRTWS